VNNNSLGAPVLKADFAVRGLFAVGVWGKAPMARFAAFRTPLFYGVKNRGKKYETANTA
jgi:hypothetical protein